MRARTIAAIVVFGAAVIAAGASASLRSVDDPSGDAHCYHDRGPKDPCSDSQKRNGDMVRATAGHEGGQLKHTIRVVGKIQVFGLAINTDSDPDCERSLSADRAERGGRTRFWGCDGPGGFRPPARRATYDFHHHSVEIFFNKRSIGNPRRYGWSASACAGRRAANARACDSVPNGGRQSYIRIDR